MVRSGLGVLFPPPPPPPMGQGASCTHGCHMGGCMLSPLSRIPAPPPSCGCPLGFPVGFPMASVTRMHCMAQGHMDEGTRGWHMTWGTRVTHGTGVT